MMATTHTNGCAGRMKKIVAMCAAAAAVAAMGVCGASAHTEKSYTFNVDTGDAVKVTLDLGGGYDMSGKVPFEVTKDGDEIFEGSFLHEEGYELYRDEILGDASSQILDEGERGGNDFIFWKTAADDATAYDYVVKVKDSGTVVLLEGTAGEEDAQQAFDHLTFTKE